MPMKPFVSVSRHLQHEAVPRFASYVRVRRLSVGALNKIGGLYWAKGMKSKPQDKTVRCELCACAHTCCSKTVVEISWNHWVLFWIGLSNFDFKMISASPAPGIPNWRLQDIFFTVTAAMLNLMKCGQLSTRMWRRSRTIWTLNFLHISFLAHVWLFLNRWLVASCISRTFLQFTQAKQQLPFPWRLRGSRRSSDVRIYDPSTQLIRSKDFQRWKYEANRVSRPLSCCFPTRLSTWATEFEVARCGMSQICSDI